MNYEVAAVAYLLLCFLATRWMHSDDAGVWWWLWRVTDLAFAWIVVLRVIPRLWT